MNPIARSIIFCLIFMYGPVGLVRAQEGGCPAGMIEVRREQAPDGHWKIYCQPIDGLTAAELAVLDPAAIDRLSPKDKAALERRKTWRTALATIDPRFFLTPEWTAYARQQRGKLIARRARLMRIESALQGQTGDFTQAITENDNLSRLVVEDDMASTLTVMGELTKAIACEGGVPSEVTANLDLSITTALTGLNSFAAVRATEEKRKSEKMIDASAGIKNILLAYPALPLTKNERDALIRGSDALLKMAKIAQRHADGEPLDWRSVAAAADDLVDALTDLPMFEAGKAARATVQMLGAEYTLARLRANQAELNRAYQSHLTSKEFLNEQIRQTDEWLSVYQSSLGPQTAPTPAKQ